MSEEKAMTEEEKFPFVVQEVNGKVHGTFRTFEEAAHFASALIQTLPEGVKIEITDNDDWLERQVIPSTRVPIS